MCINCGMIILEISSQRFIHAINNIDSRFIARASSVNERIKQIRNLIRIKEYFTTS